MKVIRIIDLTPAEDNFVTICVFNFDIQVYNWLKFSGVSLFKNTFIKNIKKGIAIVSVCPDKSVTSRAIEKRLFNYDRMNRQSFKINLPGICYFTINSQIPDRKRICFNIIVKIISHIRTVNNLNNRYYFIISNLFLCLTA